MTRYRTSFRINRSGSSAGAWTVRPGVDQTAVFGGRQDLSESVAAARAGPADRGATGRAGDLLRLTTADRAGHCMRIRAGDSAGLGDSSGLGVWSRGHLDVDVRVGPDVDPHTNLSMYPTGLVRAAVRPSRSGATDPTCLPKDALHG